MSKRTVPALVSLAAAKDAEIALLKADFQNASDAADAYCAEIAALTEQRDAYEARWRAVTKECDAALQERDAHIAGYLAACKQREEVTEQRDILTDRLDELVAFTEQRDRAMRVVKAARSWRINQTNAAALAITKAVDAFDAEAAADTAPSLPETP